MHIQAVSPRSWIIERRSDRPLLVVGEFSSLPLPACFNAGIHAQIARELHADFHR